MVVEEMGPFEDLDDPEAPESPVLEEDDGEDPEHHHMTADTLGRSPGDPDVVGEAPLPVAAENLELELVYGGAPEQPPQAQIPSVIQGKDQTPEPDNSNQNLGISGRTRSRSARAAATQNGSPKRPEPIVSRRRGVKEDPEKVEEGDPTKTTDTGPKTRSRRRNAASTTTPTTSVRNRSRRKTNVSEHNQEVEPTPPQPKRTTEAEPSRRSQRKPGPKGPCQYSTVQVIKPDEYDYPSTVAIRLMQAALGNGYKIAADAKLAVLKAASITVFRLVHGAIVQTKDGTNLKTIGKCIPTETRVHADNVLSAAKRLGIPGLEEAMLEALKEIRKEGTNKRRAPRPKKGEGKTGGESEEMPKEDNDEEDHSPTENEEPEEQGQYDEHIEATVETDAEAAASVSLKNHSQDDVEEEPEFMRTVGSGLGPRTKKDVTHYEEIIEEI